MTGRFFVWVGLVLTVLSSLVYAWFSAKLGGLTVNDLSGVIFVLGAVTVGSLIIVRKPENRFGRLFLGIGLLWAISNTLLAYSTYILSKPEIPNDIVPWSGLIGSWLSDMAWVYSATFLFLLFPNGQLPTPRWRSVAWLTGSFITVGLALNLIAPGPLSQLPEVANPLGMVGLAWLVAFLNQLEFVFVICVFICFVSIFIRYYSASPLIKRQIKWIAYLSLVLALIFVSQDLFLKHFGETSLMTQLIDYFGSLAYAAFPFVIGIAVLRYQLMDIDVIIRRTLVYALLTASLGLVYFGTVVVLQTAVGRATDEQSPLVIVFSTLLIAALFAPLRRHIQAFIDRRFYRRKYDAAQTLAYFAATARDTVSLEELSAELSTVVQNTMEPDSLSIWLGVDK